MAQNVLNVKGNVVLWSSVWRRTQIEQNSETEKLKQEELTKIITCKIGNSLHISPKPNEPSDDDIVSREDGDEDLDYLVEEEARYKKNKQPNMYEHSLYESLIHTQVLLPHNDKLSKVFVKIRLINEKVSVTSQYDINLLLNSIIYNVEFEDEKL